MKGPSTLGCWAFHVAVSFMSPSPSWPPGARSPTAQTASCSSRGPGAAAPSLEQATGCSEPPLPGQVGLRPVPTPTRRHDERPSGCGLRAVRHGPGYLRPRRALSPSSSVRSVAGRVSPNLWNHAWIWGTSASHSCLDTCRAALI